VIVTSRIGSGDVCRRMRGGVALSTVDIADDVSFLPEHLRNEKALQVAPISLGRSNHLIFICIGIVQKERL